LNLKNALILRGKKLKRMKKMQKKPLLKTRKALRIKENAIFETL